ncbi:MAG: fimbrillin family protein, partial [Bacteroidales bacterium]
MQINRLVTGALVATLSFFSCTSDETIPMGNEPIKLSAFINGPNTRVGTAWEGREKLGLFMISSGETFVPVVRNKMFNVTTNGTLSPSDSEHLYYPEDGSKVKFVGYHPHAAVGEDHIYKVDLADNTIADHDLLYTEATAEFDKTNKEAIALNFKHQLSKLTLTIQDENGNDLTGFDAKITIPTKADFNIETGVLTITPDSDKELAAQVTNDVASALVLPGSASGKIVFTAQDKNFTWDISNITLEPGKNYAYTLKLISTTEPDNKVQVVGQANIIDWGTVNGGNIDLEE